ncbi:MAG: FkbM family methyltransferase [Bacteroidia bacterium]
MSYYRFLTKKLFWHGPALVRYVRPQGEVLMSLLRQNLALEFRVGDISFPRRRWHISDFFGMLYLVEKGIKMRYFPQENAIGWELVPGRFFLTRLDKDAETYTLAEIFLDGLYDIPCEGKLILDVGSYNGDSSVYFALRGAKKVIALEPHAPNFLWAQKNIQRLGLESVISLLPYGLDSEDGLTGFYVPGGPLGGRVIDLAEAQKKNISSEQIQVKRLSTLLKEIGWDQVDIMKLDCEGCEEEVLMHEDEDTLRRIKTFIMEYHIPPKPLEARLKQLGYKVTYFRVKLKDRGHLKATLEG